MARAHFTPNAILDTTGWGPTVLKPKLDEHDSALDALERVTPVVFATVADAQAAGAAGQLVVNQFILVTG